MGANEAAAGRFIILCACCCKPVVGMAGDILTCHSFAPPAMRPLPKWLSNDGNTKEENATDRTDSI